MYSDIVMSLIGEALDKRPLKSALATVLEGGFFFFEEAGKPQVVKRDCPVPSRCATNLPLCIKPPQAIIG